MALPLRILTSLAATGLGLLAGCSPSSVEAVDSSSTEGLSAPTFGAPTSEIPTTATTRLFERMVRSHEQTAYSGIRRIEVRQPEARLEYREDVACDGEGEFAIDVVEVLEGPEDEDLFITLQHGRQAFTFQYRDFHIADLALFRENYAVRWLANDAMVAGVPCLELRVDRVYDSGQSSPSHYVLRVEPETGLVLSWQYRDAQGALLSRMEFESISFDPDLGNYFLTGSNFDGQPVDLGRNIEAQVGFDVLTPGLLPAGFEAESGHLVTTLDQTWFRRVYTDGVARIVFMHREQQSGVGLSNFERNRGQVFTTRIGNWNVVSGTLKRWELIMMGQVEPDELYQMLQAAF